MLKSDGFLVSGFWFQVRNSVGRRFKKIPGARRAMVGERRRTFSVRWSETGERNDADGAFSTAGYGSSPSTVPTPFK
jgi:hypothetical protein